MNEMTTMTLPLSSAAPRPARKSRAKLYYLSHYDGEIVVGMPQEKAIGNAVVTIFWTGNDYIIIIKPAAIGDRSVAGYAASNSVGPRWNYRWKARTQAIADGFPILHAVEIDPLESGDGSIWLALPKARLPVPVVPVVPAGLTVDEPKPQDWQDKITALLNDARSQKPNPIEVLFPPSSLAELVRQINACKAEMGDVLGLRIDDDGRLRASLEYA
jgi:hypothetical protein